MTHSFSPSPIVVSSHPSQLIVRLSRARTICFGLAVCACACEEPTGEATNGPKKATRGWGGGGWRRPPTDSDDIHDYTTGRATTDDGEQHRSAEEHAEMAEDDAVRVAIRVRRHGGFGALWARAQWGKRAHAHLATRLMT